MITGTTTKLSESTIVSADTIDPKTDIVYIYGAIPVRKIMPHFGGGSGSGMICLVNIGGNPLVLKQWDTGGVLGLIALKADLAIPQWTAIWLVYSRQHGVWFASALYSAVPLP